MSGEPPEGGGPPTPMEMEPRTERMPHAQAQASGGVDGPPEIHRFLSPPPAAPRASEPPPPSSDGGSTRRRSRRTVKIPTEAIAAAAQTVALAEEAPQAEPVKPVDDGHDGAVDKAWDPPPATVKLEEPASGEPPRPPSIRARSPSSPALQAIPAPPPVPTHRNVPTLPAVPKPASKAPVAMGNPEGVPQTPPVSPAPAPLAPPSPAPPPPAEETYEVIRPMRIISIDESPAPAPATPPPPPAEVQASAEVQPVAISSPPPKPPKPPAVEEIEAIEEVEEHAAAHAGGEEPPRGARTDEIEPIPLEEDEDHERISDADVAVTHDVEVSVEVDEAPKPKKPPPPPPTKRQLSGEIAAVTPPPPAADARPPERSSAPPPPAPAVAPAAPPPPVITAAPEAPPPASTPAPASLQTADLSGRKRQKPWWEEIFGDDFIRTLERIEPKIVRKECDFIEDRLGLEKGAIMLDLACGSGAHAVELASRGYNVVGYDLSLAMLARAQDEAQERGQKINFLHGDMREMAFEEAFDGMYSWSTSFGYFDDEKNVDVLARVHRGLRQGGMFLLDVINRDYVCPRQPSLVWFEGDGCVCMDEMFVDFFTSRLRVKRTVMFEDGRSRECEYAIRLYGLHEIGKMLHETGFKVVEVTGHPAHPGVFFGSESPRIIVLAERG